MTAARLTLHRPGDVGLERDVATEAARSWRVDEPWHEVIEALAVLFPGDRVAVVSTGAAGRAPDGSMSQGREGRPILGFPACASSDGMR